MDQLLLSIFISLLYFLCISASNNLCTHKNASCSDQLWNDDLPNDACQMIYYKLNSAHCALFHFEYKISAVNLGNVRLIAYTLDQALRTSVDIVFSHITWKGVRIRLTKIGFENERNLCRQFIIWENITLSNTTSLTYNCALNDVTYEGENLGLEYEFESSSVSYSKLIFKVPKFKNFNIHTNVKLLQIFSYVDISNSEYLKLHIQTAPAKYNITAYFIEVIRERNNVSSRLTVQVLNANEATNGELILQYDTWNEFGDFYFTITPLSDICKENVCLKSYTPKELVGRKKSSLVVGVVGASVILFALFYAMFFWNRQKTNKENNTPKVLLIYNASVKPHCEVVRSLARLLHDVLRVEVLLDVFDIPQTNHKDPLIWCSHAFTYATHIIYISSPEVSGPSIDNIYKIDQVAMQFITRELICTYSTKQILTITFPYSTYIPSELSDIKRFDLVKDMDNFINSLILLPYQSWTFLQIYRPNRFVCEPQYWEFIAKVNNAQREIEILQCENVLTIEAPKILVTVDDEVSLDDANENDVMLLKK